MPKILSELPDRQQLILMLLFEIGEKVERDELRLFLAFGSPLVSGNYKEAFGLYSNVLRTAMRSKNSDGERDLSKDLIVLQSMNLIVIEGTLRYDYQLNDEDVFIVLTETGTRVAEALCKNRLPIIRPESSSLSTVFIACAFGHPEIDKLSKKHFIPACEKLGYKPVRVDMTEPSRTLTEKIMDEITEAAYLIADLTYARPSVYFEVGYAVGLGIPLILTCRKDHERGKEEDQRVHFDLAQYKISFWEQTTSGNFKWPPSMKPDERLSLKLQPRINDEIFEI